ncbi:hypothetical protein SK128_006891, partial [Halocaridina rubra]
MICNLIQFSIYLFTSILASFLFGYVFWNDEAKIFNQQNENLSKWFEDVRIKVEAAENNSLLKKLRKIPLVRSRLPKPPSIPMEIPDIVQGNILENFLRRLHPSFVTFQQAKAVNAIQRGNAQCISEELHRYRSSFLRIPILGTKLDVQFPELEEPATYNFNWSKLALCYIGLPMILLFWLSMKAPEEPQSEEEKGEIIFREKVKRARAEPKVDATLNCIDKLRCYVKSNPVMMEIVAYFKALFVESITPSIVDEFYEEAMNLLNENIPGFSYVQMFYIDPWYKDFKMEVFEKGC